MIILVEVLHAIPSTIAGTYLILRKCSTITHNWSIYTCPLGNIVPILNTSVPYAKHWNGSYVKCAIRLEVFIARWMPTAKVSKESFTSFKLKNSATHLDPKIEIFFFNIFK